MPTTFPTTLDQLGQGWLSVLLLVGAAACWYVAVRAAAGAFRDRATAMLVAAGAPVLAGSAWLGVTGRPDGAIGLALGAAVATGTLVLGLVCNVEPVAGRPVNEDAGRRLKATLLPVAVTLLVAGFSGVLNPLHALLLLAEAGVIVWLVAGATRVVPTASLVQPAEGETAPATPRDVPGWVRGTQLGLAVVLCVAGAGFAAGATTAAGRHHGLPLDATFTSMLVAAVLALPLIGVGTTFAAEGEGPAVQRGLLLAAVAMVTIAVPVAVIAECVRQIVAGGGTPEAMKAWLTSPPNLPLLMRFWRLDAIVLALVGLLVLPSAAGRFRLGRIEGVGLIVVYVAYLVFTLISTR